MRFLSIKVFGSLFLLGLVLASALAYHATANLKFAFYLPADAAANLVWRIQLIRSAGLVFALVLMLFVILAGSRAARGTLAARWLLSLTTSFAFLRGVGLVNPLLENDGMVILASAFQLGLEAFAILVLYSDDANDWFDVRRQDGRQFR